MYYDNIVNRDRDALVSVSTPNDKLRKTLVVGLGNPILGDDGVGWRVAKSLMKICPQIEVDSGLVREPDKLQAKVNYLFDLAKRSVDAQLARRPDPRTTLRIRRRRTRG